MRSNIVTREGAKGETRVQNPALRWPPRVGFSLHHHEVAARLTRFGIEACPEAAVSHLPTYSLPTGCFSGGHALYIAFPALASRPSFFLPFFIHSFIQSVSHSFIVTPLRST